MNKIFEYEKQTLIDGLASLNETNKERGALNTEALKKDSSATLELVEKIEDFTEVIMNDGFDVKTQRKMSLKELSEAIDNYALTATAGGEKILKDFSSSSLGFFGQQIINRLITRIEYENMDLWKKVTKELVLEDGTMFYTIVLGEEGPAATSRVAEGGSFKTLNLESTEDYIKTAKGKVGVMISLPEEAIKKNGVTLMKALVHAALADMSKFKAIEAMQMLEANAKVALDALSSTPELKPSGVSRKNPQVKNGTLLMKDIRNFILKAQQDGFNIDNIFIHPLAYDVFMNEPSIKEYLKENANVYFMVPSVKPSLKLNQLDKWKNKTTGNLSQPEYKLEIPQLIKNKALNVIVTPLVSVHTKGQDVYTPATRFTAKPVTQYASISVDCCDILLVDSERALTYVHDGRGIITDKIEDKFVDVTKVKFKEYYNFILDKDPGVFAFRNMSITDDILDPDKLVLGVNYTKTEAFGA